METRKCLCGADYLVFRPKMLKVDGCKRCRQIIRHKKYYAANREHCLAKAHKRHHEEAKAKVHKRRRRYYAANAEAVKKKSKAWHQANPDAVAASSRRYYVSHRAECLARTRVGRRRLVEKDLTVRQIVTWRKLKCLESANKRLLRALRKNDRASLPLLLAELRAMRTSTRCSTR